MITLHIEHAISDLPTWKAAFDHDPARREQSGVRSHRIAQPVDDPNYIMIDLDFDSASQAEAFLAGLHEVWGSRQAAPALVGRPQTRIIETVESKEY
jgi:hypothetical protein